jgi:hypothetical protein
LQKLIDVANNYLNEHDLNFNAQKTKCTIFGKCFFVQNPSWYLGGSTLGCETSFEYLGAVMSEKSLCRIEKRIKACRQSFYAINRASKNCNPQVVTYLWKAAIQPCLTYANECFLLRQCETLSMEKLQAKLIKCALHLSKYSFTTPLMNALNIKRISVITEVNCLKLLRCIMCTSTRGRVLYFDMLKYNVNVKTDLLTRSKRICHSRNVTLTRLLTDDSRINCLNSNITNGGLVDSLKQCFCNYIV